MNDDRGPRQVTGSLPEGLSEALAFYDRLAESAASREDARKQAVAQFSDWAEALREHFRVEDCLLGVTDSPFDSTQLGMPPDGSLIAGASATAAGAIQSRLIPRYLLGVGGQGEVWLAHDPELDRFVALKVIKEAQRGSQPTAARFWREAELTGKLEHPNIVPVYEAGKSAGSDKSDGDAASPYYVMRVFGNRHLLRAITAFHARERRQQDWELLEAIKAFHEDRSVANEQRLRQALQSFVFDEKHECDRDLKDACEALRNDPAGQSGRSLQEAIVAYHASGRQPSELRELLNRFIDVCNAMAYAHSRGVIHRDLKPQNVMLGEFGETLVVDWGLAKVVGQQERTPDAIPGDTLRMAADESERDSHTQQGTVVGTLAYMPPEQAWGKIDELTAATDVYSLGGILYMLLTGQPPRTGTTKTQLLESARSGQVAAPTSIQPEVPKALEAVCLKALSKSPVQRYPTAKDLAADVGRWLADEPVTAWPEPVIVRAKRWVKGHQTLVGSTAAAVLVAVVTLSTLVVVVSGKNSELNTAYDNLDDRNDQLTQANTDLVAANQREESARILAQNNETAAREQSQLALSTLTQVIVDVQRGLKGLPGGSEVRRRLLTTSLEKLEQVATEYVEQATVDLITMSALNDMGDVILRFGVGEEQTDLAPHETAAAELSVDQRSAVALAESFYTRAHDIAAELSAADPTNAQAQRDLFFSYNKLGDVQWHLGDTQSALGFYQQSHDIAQRLATTDPTNTQAQRNLLVAYDRLGIVCLELGDTASALGFYQQLLDISQALAAADPTSTGTQRDLSVAYIKLGDTHAQSGDNQLARDLFLQANEIQERLAADDPLNSETQRDLSLSYERLGNVSLLFDDTTAARSFYEKMNTIKLHLASADPTNAQAQRDLSISYNKLGGVQWQRGDTQSALGFYQQSHGIAERLASADPLNSETQRDLSLSYNKLGDVQLQLGDTQSALGFYQQSLDIRERLTSADPTNAQAQRDLSLSYENLGDVSLQLGDTPSALQFYQQGLDISERLAAADPLNSEAQRDLSLSYQRLGNVQLQLGDTQSALGFYQQSLDISERLTSADPTNAQAQRDLSLSYNKLGDVQWQLGDTQSALGFYQQSHDIAERLAAADPGNAQSQRELSLSYQRLGNVQLQLGDTQSALGFYQQGLEIRERLASADPTNAQAQRDLSISYIKLGDVQWHLGDTQSALRFYQQYNALCERLAAADPGNAQSQRDLSISYSRLADVSLQLGDTQLALEFYQSEFEIKERLAAADPANSQAQRELSATYCRLARADTSLLDYDAAIEQYTMAISILDQMIANGQNVSSSQQEREAIASEMRTVEREGNQARAAVGDWEKFIHQPGARSRLALRITLLARAGRFGEIPQSAAMLRTLDAENYENLYNAACGYAVCANAIQPADAEALTAEQLTQRQEYIDLALACLRESIAAGWSDFEHIQQDPDLAVLRELPEFEELMHTPPPPPLPR